MEEMNFNESVSNTLKREIEAGVADLMRQRFPNAYIDSEKRIPEPEYTLEVRGVPIAAKGNLMGISGHAKGGKTSLVTMFGSSWLGSKRYQMETYLSEDAKLLITDSDQSSYFTARVKRRIQRMLGWAIDENQDRLVAMNLRRIPADDRLAAVSEMIKTMRPDVIVVDNIAHFGVDFNDSHGSRSLVDELCRLAEVYNCLIVVVLHTNKSQEDSNMKGHLGSMVQEACSDVIQVKHPSGSPTHDVVHLLSRDTNFGRFAFQFGDDGLPILSETAREMEEKARSEAKQKSDCEVMKRVFGQKLMMRYSELIEVMKTKLSMSESSAKRLLNSSMDIIIRKDELGNYMLIS